MKELMHSYRKQLIARRILILMTMALIIVPVYLLIAQKINHYNNPVNIDYFHATLQKQQDENELLCMFQSNCLINQRLSWEDHTVYGPLQYEGQPVYLIQMEDAYFVAVTGDLQHDHEQIGGVSNQVDDALIQQAKSYVMEHGIVDEESAFAYQLSPYLLKQGYIGNASKQQFWGLCLIGVVALFGGCILLGLLYFSDVSKAYRLFQKLPPRYRSDAEKEVVSAKMVHPIIFGEKLFYVKVKRKGCIYVFPYAMIIWCQYQDGVLSFMDKDRHYVGMQCQKAMFETLVKHLRFSVIDDERKTKKNVQRQYPDLLKQSKQIRKQYFKKQQFRYEDHAL